MADIGTDKKLKLANSRKRFKELQELKKKRNADLQNSDAVEHISNVNTPVESMTSSTHSSINNDTTVEKNVESYIDNQLTNYFNNSNYNNLEQQPAMFFDSFSQSTDNINNEKKDFFDSSTNIFDYFNSSSPQSTFMQNMVSNVVGTPIIENAIKEPQFHKNEPLFQQENKVIEVTEPQVVDYERNDFIEGAELNQTEDINLHDHKVHSESDYVQNSNKETISETENCAIQNEITDSSKLAQAQHSSIESLKQLSNQMAQFIEPEYSQFSSSITDLEKRNLELAAHLEQEKLKKEQQKFLINELQIKIAQMESDSKAKEEHSNLQVSNELSRLKEELQYHIQTVGLLVAEKTELSANLGQLELTSKQKNAECEELQARLKASRSRVADLERELNILKNEKSRNENIGQEQIEIMEKLKQECNLARDQKDEMLHDLLEVREKLKNCSEENIHLQQQNQELSSKLSLANIKIQQITNGEQSMAGDQIEKLTNEKFELEKQLSNLNLILKTITKERDESNMQYQQYAQQLNAQISNLSNKIIQLQQENENLSIQEQNRIKHLGELERQLQNLQNEHINFATNTKSNGDVNLKDELENTRELCIQLQIEKTNVEENLTKTLNEKDMLLKELDAKNDSLSQLESMVEQLRGNQPDSVKLLATMESDKVAAARAVQQNKELKEQMESMQEVFMKLDHDKVELTDQLNIERISNKDLLEKLQKVELQLQRLTDAIEIKDRELSNLRETSTEVDKLILQQEQLTDRLRHYEAHDNSSFVLQQELQESKQTVIKLTNEINSLKNEKIVNKTSLEIENISHNLINDVNNQEIQHGDLENKISRDYSDSEKTVMHNKNAKEDNNNVSDQDNSLDKESAMKCLEEKFKKTMQDIADLTDEKQRLEHLVLQLQSETETIGEYVALYQHQRMVLKQRALEKDQQLKQLASDREQIKIKLEQLNELIKRLVAEKGEVPHELLMQHRSLTHQSDNFCEEHTKIHEEISKINDQNPVNSANNSETAEKIIELLSEIKSSNLVQPDENFHHCPWCSGQLITV